MRQWLEGFLPEETDVLLDKLYEYRKSLKGDFDQKNSSYECIKRKITRKK